ncbi:MAG: aldehyde dehydrogenase family protein [Lentimicrobium sp.]|jgi:glyceraldehyde-3-phosphate dehydrogenase (NADP+)|nr:aldehyde dehydrogenase family protein [Lentimicrobium sp.]
MNNKEVNIFMAGRFVRTDQPLNVINPFDQSSFATTFLASKKELETAISAAEDVKETLKHLPAYERYNILMHISRQLKVRHKEFAHTLMLESGKPLKYAQGEIDRSIQTFVVAAEEAKRLPRESLSLDWTPSGKQKEGLVRYFPIGLVAGIAPFNFPLNLAVHKIAPAIAAGCPIILKPSSKTPLSTLKLAEIIAETSLPAGAVSILPMDRETGNQLVTDKRFAMLSFTGSPEVGWKMKAEAGKKKVVLELGGNAGVIVTESADPEKVISKCVGGAFAYSGQVCIHAQRLFVHRKIFEAFSQSFVKLAGELKIGNPDSVHTDISSMIDEENAIRVESWVNEAVQSGARCLAGGQREGSYYPPTVLTNTRNEMKVCHREIFGPVVTLEPYETFDEAIKQINDTRFGLQAGVFTNKTDEMNQAFDQLEVGGVIINDVPTFRVDHMPYGGIKDSGLGREGVKYAILDMMEARILVKDF